MSGGRQLRRYARGGAPGGGGCIRFFVHSYFTLPRSHLTMPCSKTLNGAVHEIEENNPKRLDEKGNNACNKAKKDLENRRVSNPELTYATFSDTHTETADFLFPDIISD